MLLTLAHPWLADAVANGAPANMLADWLDDQGAALTDVLRLFAGTPEGAYLDGLSREALALWLEAHPAGRRLCSHDGLPVPAAEAVRRARVQVVPPSVVLVRARGDPAHFAGVVRGLRDGERVPCAVCDSAPRVSLRLQKVKGLRAVGFGRCLACGTPHWATDDDGPERRDLTRAVLALFADVCCSVERRGRVLEFTYRLAGGGWRRASPDSYPRLVGEDMFLTLDRALVRTENVPAAVEPDGAGGWRVRQEVPAHLLVPPEGLPRGW